MSWSLTNNTKLIFPQDDKLLGEINYMNMAVLLGMQETDFFSLSMAVFRDDGLHILLKMSVWD